MFLEATARRIDAVATSASFVGFLARDAQGRVAITEPAGHFRGVSATIPKVAIAPGERASDALARCLREKLGVTPRAVYPLPGPWTTEGDVGFFFAGSLGTGSAPPTKPESHLVKAVHWCDRHEAARRLMGSPRAPDRVRDLQLLAFSCALELSFERRLFLAVRELNRMGFERLRVRIARGGSAEATFELSPVGGGAATTTLRHSASAGQCPFGWDDAVFDSPSELADRVLRRVSDMIFAAAGTDPAWASEPDRLLADPALDGAFRWPAPPAPPEAAPASAPLPATRESVSAPASSPWDEQVRTWPVAQARVKSVAETESLEDAMSAFRSSTVPPPAVPAVVPKPVASEIPAPRQSAPPAVPIVIHPAPVAPVAPSLEPLRFAEAPRESAVPEAAPVSAPEEEELPEPSFDLALLRRARGAMLGMAVGDALGAPEVSRRCDEANMGCSLARSLVVRGAFDLDDVAVRYSAWVDVAVEAGPQTRAVLAKVKRGERPHTAARALWEEGQRRPATRGSLVRSAPLALFFADDAWSLEAASLDEAAITHYDPRCRIAGAAYNAAIARLVIGGDDIEGAFGAARRAVASAARTLVAREPRFRHEVESARSALYDDLNAARSDDPGLNGPAGKLVAEGGQVRIAFRLAFWQLAHAASFEAALLDVVQRGGDADTNAAVTGTLLGARFGDEVIPSRWTDAVLAAPVETRKSTAATEYHPKVLLRFAEDLNARDHG